MRGRPPRPAGRAARCSPRLGWGSRGSPWGRSEKRRVGEEGRTRGVPGHLKKKKEDRVAYPRDLMHNRRTEILRYTLWLDASICESICCVGNVHDKAAY